MDLLATDGLAGARHVLRKRPPEGVVEIVGIGSAVGAVLGARATMVLGGRQLKLAIAALITIGAVATLVKAWPGS